MTIREMIESQDAPQNSLTCILTLRHEDLDGAPAFTTVAIQKAAAGWQLRFFDNGAEDTELTARCSQAQDVADAFRAAFAQIPASYEEVTSEEDLLPSTFLWLAEYDEESGTVSPC